jgi:hypothetical protein
VLHPEIVAFARVADGSAQPTRQISGQKTLLTRLLHDMAYDPVRDEIFVVNSQIFAVLAFKADAHGDVAPIRKIMGPKTQLGPLPNGRVSLDSVNHELYVPMGDKVVVFPQDADGDVAPIRVLEGPATRLGASAVAVDPVHNLLIVSGRNPDWESGGRGQFGASDLIISGPGGRKGTLEGGSMAQIAIFERTASGNTKPLRVIAGSNTMLSYQQILMTTYPPRGWILGAVWGSEYGEIAADSDKSFVGVWSIHDNGDVAPRWTIGGPKGILRAARGVAISPDHKTVFVSDKDLGAILSFQVPEIF